MLSRGVGADFVVSTDEGDPYFLAGTAREIWELLDTPRTVDQIADALSRHYEDASGTLVPTVAGFVDDLAHRGLVEAVDPPGA